MAYQQPPAQDGRLQRDLFREDQPNDHREQEDQRRQEERIMENASLEEDEASEEDTSEDESSGYESFSDELRRNYGLPGKRITKTASPEDIIEEEREKALEIVDKEACMKLIRDYELHFPKDELESHCERVSRQSTKLMGSTASGVAVIAEYSAPHLPERHWDELNMYAYERRDNFEKLAREKGANGYLSFQSCRFWLRFCPLKDWTKYSVTDDPGLEALAMSCN